MERTSFIRLGGLVLMVGVLCSILGYLISPETSGGAADVMSALYIPSAVLKSLGALLGLLGLPAMYATLAHKTRWFGMVSYALLFLGLGILEVGSTMLSLVGPALFSGDISGQLGTEAGLMQSPGAANAVILKTIGLLALNLGILLYGIVVIRAKVFSRWAGGLMCVGIVATFLGMPLIPQLAERIGIPLSIIGLGWCGLQLVVGKLTAEKADGTVDVNVSTKA